MSTGLYTAERTRQLDAAVIHARGISGYELMCDAAEAVVQAVRSSSPDSTRWLVVAGAGNNGGDGYVIARLARALGHEASVVALKDPNSLEGDARRAADDWHAAGGEIHAWSGALDERAEVLVDALLGTGLDREVEGDYAAAIASINEFDGFRVSVDVPSGLSADTGQVMGTAVQADLTVTFIARKPGLYTADGPDHCGRLVFDQLSAPASVFEKIEPDGRLIGIHWLSSQLGPRARNSHKGSFGHVVVTGGGPGMVGAVVLAGEAALRSGAGKVTVASHPEHALAVSLGRPELMTHSLEALSGGQPLPACDVLALGPGLGQQKWSLEVFKQVIGFGGVLVLDADALNLLAKNPVTRDNWILTPHPAEAGRLLNITTAEVQNERIDSAKRMARKFDAVVVLKGCGTVIADPSGKWSICHLGNPGMATAGSGDVLTGIVAAMAAQGHANYQAACMAVCAHAAAGDRAAIEGQRGLIASDIIGGLRGVLNG